MVSVVSPSVERGHKHLVLRDLTLQGLQGGRNHALELWALLSSVCIKQVDCVSVLRSHGVWSDVLNVSDQKIAVVRAAHGGGVDVLHHEPEEVVVPLEDEVPEVALVELFGPVEEVPVGLDGDRGHRVLRLQIQGQPLAKE